jgi:hypothetical protein
MWEPQRLTTLWAFTAWYRDSFTLLHFISLHLLTVLSQLTIDTSSDFGCLLQRLDVRIVVDVSVALAVSLKTQHVAVKRVPRRIFGPKRDEVKGGWRKVHNEGLHNLYCSPSIIRMIKSRRMRLAGHVARMGEKMYIRFCWKIEKESERPRRMWEDNIKMILREIGWDAMDWIDLTQCREK